jgi:hypothetical protein
MSVSQPEVFNDAPTPAGHTRGQSANMARRSRIESQNPSLWRVIESS